MSEYGGIVDARVQSQAVAVGVEVAPTSLEKQNLVQGFRKIDLGPVERKILIPGERTRAAAEEQYGIIEEAK